MKSRSEVGFTRVELTVVIVILGILATVAVPRFMSLETEARVAAIKSMGGTLKSAANKAHSICLAQACENSSVIVIDGQNVTFVNGYPNEATVGSLVQRMEGFTANSNGNRFTRNGSKTADCWVQYNEAAAGSAPTISYQSGTITNANSETAVNTALRAQC